MWRINILRALRTVMGVKRKSVKCLNKAAKATKDPRWVATFNKLASYDSNRLESLELIHDTLAENNEWLTLQDIFDETPKPLDVEQLFREIIPGEVLTEQNTIDACIKADEEILRLYEEIMKDCESRFKAGQPVIEWLIHQVKEHHMGLNSLKRGEHTNFLSCILNPIILVYTAPLIVESEALISIL